MWTGMMYRCRTCGFTRRTDWPSKPEQRRCPQGHEMKGMIIEAHKHETVKCDSRCTHAKGHTCDCSCGGENHGMAYA